MHVENRYRNTRDGKYRRKQVSIQYKYFGKSIDSIAPQISFRKSHHELHIQKLVTYFNVLQLSDLFFKIFRFLRHLPHFCTVSGYFVLDFFLFGIFGHYSRDNTKYRYLNKVSIPNDTKRYRYSIHRIDTISHHYKTLCPPLLPVNCLIGEHT